ncbi:expressed unknown protein [Seminavis robusta]|uniref:Uncharacterized protein n=1 Tax=Seminavis robusta TaxID=568900 RepID=A0A9N8ENC6_9STRA|nr:expressed unknown protein [Seminavis robusta]|eukprot:Sro1521_g279480.1 n/a (244) ;mRNA; f:12898-13629
MASNGEYESRRGKATREGLREEILGVAVKNARMRFFIPSTDNSFGGIKYTFVMIDSGCDSMLLPFPSNADDLRVFEEDIFTWQIFCSGGTPTLVISRIDGLSLGSVVLAGRQVIELPFLRFHLGSVSAQAMVAHERLDEDESAKLDSFLLQLGPNHILPERQHVLIGQTVLSKTYSLQAGKMLFIMRKGYLPVRDDLVAAWNVVKNLEKPVGFDDLVDDDHDGDWVTSFDDEDCTESCFMDEN